MRFRLKDIFPKNSEGNIYYCFVVIRPLPNNFVDLIHLMKVQANDFYMF